MYEHEVIVLAFFAAFRRRLTQNIVNPFRAHSCPPVHPNHSEASDILQAAVTQKLPL